MEILIAMVIAAVLLSVAVPSLTSFIKNNRILAETNNFMTVIKTARTEAMTLRTTITVCRTSDNINCDGTGDNFIAFTDANTADLVDGTDVIIQRTTIDTSLLTIGYDGGNSIRFDSRGRAIGSSGTIMVCDDRGNDYRRGITIEPIGRSKPAIEGDFINDC